MKHSLIFLIFFLVASIFFNLAFADDLTHDEVDSMVIPSSGGITISDVKQKVVTLNAKGGLTEAEKEELADLTAIANYAEDIKKYRGFITMIDKFIAENKGKTKEQLIPNRQKIISEHEIERLKDEEKLKKGAASLSDYKNNIQKLIDQLTGYVAKLTSLPKDAQQKILVNTDKIIENQNLLTGTSLNSLTKSRIMKLYVENESLTQENTLIQYSLDNNLTSLEILNNQLAALKEELAKIDVAFDLITKKIDTIRRESVLNEQYKQLAENKNIAPTHPLIKILQDENTQYIARLEKSFDEVNRFKKINSQLEALISRTKKIETDLNSQVELFNDTVFLSKILFNQRQYIPTYDIPINLGERISGLQVDQYNYNSELEHLNTPELFIKAKIEQNEIKEEIDDQTKQTLEKLLLDRKATLTNLNNELITEINTVVGVQINYSKYIKLKDNLSSTIYEQMFWSQSSQKIGKSWLKDFVKNLEEELKNAKSFTEKITYKYTFNFFVFLGYLFILMGLAILFLGKRIHNRIVTLSKAVGRFSKDNHLITIKSLLLSLLKTSSLPLMLLGSLILSKIFFSFELEQNSSVYNHPVLVMGLCYVWFSLFYCYLMKPNGIFEQHFSQKMTHKGRILQMLIFILILFISTLVIFKLFKPETFSYDVLGQAVFIILNVSLGVIFILRIKNKLTIDDSIWSKIIGLIIIGALGLETVLAYLGYFYSAVRIAELLILTYFIILAYSLIYITILRSLSLAARRLNFKRMQEARAQRIEEEKQHKDHKDAEFADEKILSDSIDEVMPISEISHQSEQLLKYLLISVFAIILYAIWSDIIGLIQYIEYIKFYNILGEDGEVAKTINLMDILLILYCLLITYIVIKNIPGVLQVLVFQRFTTIGKFSYSIVSIITYVMIAFCVIFCSSKLGLRWEQLQWLVAALSVGLGFGLQEIFGNFIAGLIILFERPIRIGDVITIDGHSGIVSKIRIRATTITEFNRKDYVVPNKTFITSPIVNWSLNDPITRLDIAVDVAYGSDVELVKETLRQIGNECHYLAKEPQPTILFVGFGASNLNFEFRVYVAKTSERNVVLDMINTEVYKRFNELGIEIAFDQMDVYIKNTHNDQEIKVSHVDYKKNGEPNPKLVNKNDALAYDSSQKDTKETKEENKK